MWYINVKGRRMYLTPKEDLVLGKKNGELVFQNDPSINKMHASICVIPENEPKAGEPTSRCIIKDLNSEYGSYILREENEIRITTEGCELKDRDRVQLGRRDLILTIVHVPIMTMTSSLNHEEETIVGHLLTNLIGGVISTKWTKSCTHLTAIKPKLTEKVAFAMAAGIPIVSLDYWSKVRIAMRKDEPIPDPKNFTPEIAEPMIDKSRVSLCPNIERKTLFKDKIFVFLCKQQYETYREIIHLAGGNAVVYSHSSFTVKDLCTPKVIVITFPFNYRSESTQNVVPDYDEICDALRAARRKMTPAAEIYLSLLHCSTKKFCNPTFRMEELLRRRSLEPDNSEILAMDTPNVRILPKIVSNVRLQVAVPGTCDRITDFIKNRAREASHKPQNSVLSPTRKRAITPETIESQEESNGNGKRSTISSDEKIDAFTQNDRTYIYDLLKNLPEIEVIPKKLLKKKRVTFEASCEKDKSEIGTEIKIIPETPEKNVEYSDGNLMPTSPIRLGDDISSNSFETPIVERQTTRNVSLKEKADKNCDGKFTEGGTWRCVRNEASKRTTVPLEEISNTTYKPKLNLRKPIGKTFKKVYQVQKPAFRGYYNS